MPEINTNQVKSAPAPKPAAQEKLFEIPNRRRGGFKKFIIIPFLMVLILVGAAIIYTHHYKPAPVVVTSQPKEEESQVKAGTSFYLTTEISEGDNSKDKTTRLYQYSPDSNIDDKEIAKTDEKNFRVIGKTPKAYTYIATSDSHKLFTLDAGTGKITELFELAEDPLIRDVAVSEDGQWLAYERNFEGSGTGKSGGAIWLYNFETKEQKELVKKAELGLYQGYSVLGWRDNDKEIIVASLGGDAGATWGEIDSVNITTGVVTKVNPVPEKDAMDFLRGQLSPDGNKWLYEHCEKPDNAKSEGLGDQACASGAELRTYDFETKAIKTVYQNLRYDNNVDKNMLRVFVDFKWQGNNHIIASVPGAILNITTGTGKAEEVYTFDQSNPQNYRNHYLQINTATEDQIVFSDEGKLSVLDLHSGKSVTLDRSKDKEVIFDWLN